MPLAPNSIIDVSSAGNSAGSVLLYSLGSGGITGGIDIIASGSGVKNYGGSIIVVAPGGPVSLSSIDARGLGGAYGGSVVVSGGGNVTLGGAAGTIRGV